MKLPILLLLAFNMVAFLPACKSSKKTASKPKTTSATKPKTTPTKTTTTTTTSPKTDPTKQLVFEESELLSPILEKAQKLKKPVFLVFSASWCAPCKVMKEEVFSQFSTFSYLNKNFLNFEVNTDLQSGKNIAGLYGVSALPTIIFVDPQGVELEKKIGMATHTHLTQMGDAALVKMRNK